MKQWTEFSCSLRAYRTPVVNIRIYPHCFIRTCLHPHRCQLYSEIQSIVSKQLAPRVSVVIGGVVECGSCVNAYAFYLNFVAMFSVREAESEEETLEVAFIQGNRETTSSCCLDA